MIILTNYLTNDPEGDAWRVIRQYKNTHFTTKKIIEIHKLDPENYDNAKKQAYQIRSCIMQAEEYLISIKSVSSITRPVILYYFVMSLALIEILFKQSGLSSLDKARETNRHHGLSFHIDGKIEPKLELDMSACLVSAKPIFLKGKRGGTFELWHSSSREHPIIGLDEVIQEGYKSTNIGVLFTPVDGRMPRVPNEGYNLLELVKMLPNMGSKLYNRGVINNLAKVRFKRLINTKNSTETNTINFLPTFNPEVYKEILEDIIVNDLNVDCMDFVETGNGLIWTIRRKLNSFRENTFSLPHCFSVDSKNSYMCNKNFPLNEFGIIYMISYICSNLSRYYPEIWLQEVEKSSSLSEIVDEISHTITQRAPVLLASELFRSLIVKDSYNN